MKIIPIDTRVVSICKTSKFFLRGEGGVRGERGIERILMWVGNGNVLETSRNKIYIYALYLS